MVLRPWKASKIFKKIKIIKKIKKTPPSSTQPASQPASSQPASHPASTATSQTVKQTRLSEPHHRSESFQDHEHVTSAISLDLSSSSKYIAAGALAG